LSLGDSVGFSSYKRTIFRCWSKRGYVLRYQGSYCNFWAVLRHFAM